MQALSPHLISFRPRRSSSQSLFSFCWSWFVDHPHGASCCVSVGPTTILKWNTKKWRKHCRALLALSRLEGLLLFLCAAMMFALFAVAWDCWLMFSSNPCKLFQCWLLCQLLLIFLLYCKCLKINSLFPYFFQELKLSWWVCNSLALLFTLFNK